MRRLAATSLAYLSLLLTGCGTFQNLKAPPERQGGFTPIEPTSCVAFGGFQRSMLGAVSGSPIAILKATEANSQVADGKLADGMKRFGEGIAYAAGGIVSAADMPLSLVADVATLPVVYARQRSPWATSWGETNQIDPRWEKYWINDTDATTPIRVSGGVGP